MPLVQISLMRGKSPAHVRAIADAVYQAMRETFNVPPGDRFQTIHQLDRDELIYDPDYLGIHRTDDVVFIQIAARASRDIPTKQAFYKRLVDLLVANPGLRPEDVLITLTLNDREDWSFGHGKAQYVEKG
jgi:phenylpyruvate tautomerase PptA (4-oxalocrotonate tautomerase family)